MLVKNLDIKNVKIEILSSNFKKRCRHDVIKITVGENGKNLLNVDDRLLKILEKFGMLVTKFLVPKLDSIWNIFLI